MLSRPPHHAAASMRACGLHEDCMRIAPPGSIASCSTARATGHNQHLTTNGACLLALRCEDCGGKEGVWWVVGGGVGPGRM